MFKNKLLIFSILFFTICYNSYSQNTNNLCVNANPFCTEDNPYGITFPAGTDATATPDLPESQRGCLYYTPAPAWYVMQIDNPGDMLIYMRHSGGRDIDFACWGPFTGYANQHDLVQAVCTSQLTGNGHGNHRPTNGYHDPDNPNTWGGYPDGNLVDCSYSAESTEWCFIPNALHGQWYVFLITNYSRVAGDITFEVQGATAGTATTNCDILANVSNNGPLCAGQALQLTCSAYSSTYSWTGPNGFTSNEPNPIIYNAQPEHSGTYTVTYVSGGETHVTSTTVEVFPRPTAAISVSPESATICNGGHVTLSAVGASDCEDCQFRWSTGATSPSIDVMPSVTTAYGLTVSNGNCYAVTTQVVTVGSVPTVAVTPAVVTLCEAIGSVDLNAITSRCGTGCEYLWSNGGESQVLTVHTNDIPASSADGVTYTVTVTNSYGCTAEASAVVRLEAGSNVSECNVFYASPTGNPASQGLTPSSPTTIQHAIELASCTDAIIRLAVGTYTINKSLQLASNMTLEGGFFDEYRQKTSEPGQTTIYRTSENPEGTSRAPRLVAIEANSLNNFRLQDLTVQTADAQQLPPLQTSNTNFDDMDCTNGTEPGEPVVSLVYGQMVATTQFPGPLPGSYAYYRYAALYTAAEMGNEAFTITAIGYDVASAASVPSDGHPRRMKVWMKQTTRQNFTTPIGGMRAWSYLTSAQPGFSEPAAVLVFDGTVCVNAGRVTIPVNFDYDPSSNLMILVENEGCKFDGAQQGYCPTPVRCGPSTTGGPMCIGAFNVPQGGNAAWTGVDPQLNSNTNYSTAAHRPNTYFYSCTERSVEGVVVATVGNGAAAETFPLPGDHGHHRMAALYSSNEIGTGPKMLTGLDLEVSNLIASADGGRTRSVRVYLKNTTSTALTGGQVWNSYLSGASLVYSGTLCIDGPGWVGIPVSNFAYEGESLLVLVEGEGCSATGGCSVSVLCHLAESSCTFFTTDDQVYHSVNTLSLSSNRPNIRFYSLSEDEDDYYVAQSNYGVSTYAIHISNSHSYDLVRCQFISGNASSGRDGTPGKDGGDGGDGGDGAKGTDSYCAMSGNNVQSMNWGGSFAGGAGGAAGVAGYSAGTSFPASQGGQGGNGGTMTLPM